MTKKNLVKRFESRLDLHQSPMHAQLMQEIGWITLGKPGQQVFVRKLGKVGIAKTQRPQKVNLPWLNQIRKKYHLLTLYVEPPIGYPTHKTLGFSVEPFAHSATSLIDLKLSEKELLNSFSQKTRYNIMRNLRKNQLTLISTALAKLTNQQKSDLYELRTSWSRSKGVVGYPEPFLKAVIKTYSKHGVLHTAYLKDTCVAALLILYHEGVATYYAAFATPQGYHSFAPTLLTWEAMKAAKKKGCDIFDFGGIYDERYPSMYKRWRGFTKFKEGFSPTPLKYPKTHLKIGWPLI